MAAKKARPEDLVELAYQLTKYLPPERAEAVRLIVAHLAIVVGGAFPERSDELWREIIELHKSLQPVDTKRAQMWRCRTYVERLLIKGKFSLTELRHLATLSDQAEFLEITAADMRAALTDIRSVAKRTTTGRASGGSGKKTSPALVVARLACACGAWAFGPDDVDRAKRLISRNEK